MPAGGFYQENRAMSYALLWRMRRGVEVPVVEPAKGDALRYGIARPTKREAIELALVGMRKNLAKAQDSARVYGEHVAQLERLLEKEQQPT
jgi:hypothetical protein